MPYGGKMFRDKRGLSHIISIVLAIAATVIIVAAIVAVYGGYVHREKVVTAQFIVSDAPAPVSRANAPAIIISYAKGEPLEFNSTTLTIIDEDGNVIVNAKNITSIKSDSTNFTYIDSDGDGSLSPGDQIIVTTNLIKESKAYSIQIATRGQLVYQGTITPG